MVYPKSYIFCFILNFLCVTPCIFKVPYLFSLVVTNGDIPLAGDISVCLVCTASVHPFSAVPLEILRFLCLDTTGENTLSELGGTKTKRPCAPPALSRD